MIVSVERLPGAVHAGFVQDDDMVQTFSANGTDDPLDLPLVQRLVKLYRELSYRAGFVGVWSEIRPVPRAPSIAIDLPLKVLVWESADGQMWISYNASAYLQTRHRLDSDLLKNIAVVEEWAAKVAE